MNDYQSLNFIIHIPWPLVEGQDTLSSLHLKQPSLMI